MKLAEKRRVFIIRPSDYVQVRKWQYDELRAGRVREGWGKSGLSLVQHGQLASEDEWAEKLYDWLKGDGKTTLRAAKMRFHKFCLMLEMRPGDCLPRAFDLEAS